MTRLLRDPLGDLGVSRETLARLQQFVALMEKWNPAINLVSKSTLADAWNRHVVDSAQIYALAPQSATHWADLGSGGGFPGLVIAILADELNPALRVTLVESDQRKATFLRQAGRTLGVSADVRAERIESLGPLGADVLSARALAALPQLCAFADRHRQPEGTALFPKGATHAKEIAEARALWHMDLTIHPSVTDPEAVILHLKRLAHA